MSNDLHTLSGAYALDALSPEEVALFDTHLQQCPACRDEVRELREAAARMGAGVAVAPSPDLKARVLAAADRQPQLPPQVTPLERVRSRRWATMLIGAAAAVLLFVAAGVGIKALQHPSRPDVTAASVARVFDAPDAHTATVRTSTGATLRVATSAEFGQMAVSTRSLPALSNRAYQMWAIHNGRATSVGLIADPRAGKVMPMPASGTTVAITVEPAGGSKQPTQSPIIEMDPATV